MQYDKITIVNSKIKFCYSRYLEEYEQLNFI